MSGSQHWVRQRERGSLACMRVLAWALRRVGRRWLQPVVWMVVAYFYLTSRQARRHTASYQDRLATFSGRAELRPTWRSVWAQYWAFATALLDKLDVWQGRLDYADLVLEDPHQVCSEMGHGRGQVMVGAHLGNPEVCRALADRNGHVRVNVLVHTRHAERFNRLLTEAGADNLRLVQVSELDPATLLLLKQRLDAGEWLAIAGDRVSLQGNRVVAVDFLGHSACLPQGPWLLAGLLECPVNLFYCVRVGGRHHVRFERLTERVVWTRAQRPAVVQALAQRYADSLAQACLRSPLQWFNFYDFWSKHDA
ncbi:MAG: hypothetical protein GAK30_00735 [Paracidovorax wautersii]|uniref:Glycosyl transferase n=1 Tax=Paracidovorax wautersii TaxID=1177982 RepID=A0A7V8JRA8_9BURK|nr:MAG: hypothetical protein GAK30_00735 [Paracidovorax wautersii]